MMRRAIAIAVLMASFAASEAGAAEFSYSATSGPTCTTIRSKREFNSWRCPGPAGYGSLFHDLGNMVAVELGLAGKERAIIEDGLIWQGADKAFGSQVEWRLINGKPYAAILRTWRQDFEEEANLSRAVEELLVIKVSSRGACRVGVIDGKRRDANSLAREMADTVATTFRCGTRSVAHGHTVSLISAISMARLRLTLLRDDEKASFDRRRHHANCPASLKAAIKRGQTRGGRRSAPAVSACISSGPFVRSSVIDDEYSVEKSCAQHDELAARRDRGEG